MMRRVWAVVPMLLLTLSVAACDSETQAIEPTEGSFYLEARVSVEPSGPDPTQPSLLPTVSELRWWYLDAGHYRHEIEEIDTIVEWPSFVIVADGEKVRGFDPRSLAYQEIPLPDGANPYGGRPPFSIILGPLPASSLDAFIEQWGETTETVERVGTAEVMGRPVEVVEFGPIWRESSGQSNAVAVETSGGLGRIYVDTGLGMVLRYEVVGNEGRGQNYHAEVTLLDLGPEFTSETFVLNPPAGARRLDSHGSCGVMQSGGAGMWSFGSGYLRPGYDPQGWSPAGSGSTSGSDCAVTEEWGAITRGENDVIVLEQKPIPVSGAPAIRGTAVRVDLGGTEGYRATSEGRDGPVEELLWIEDGVIARLQTNAAPFEELVRIAKSVEVVP